MRYVESSKMRGTQMKESEKKKRSEEEARRHETGRY